jgi:hypothetical protein
VADNWIDAIRANGYPESRAYATSGACLESWGPDRVADGVEWAYWFIHGPSPNLPEAYARVYDPTNGTVSAGDIIRYVGDVRISLGQ